MKPDGGPAFPFVLKENGAGEPGMSLRDYFAAHALTGILAAPGALPNKVKVAVWAYEYADAMLEARKS